MIWNSRVDAFSPSDTLTLLASNKRNAVSGARLPTAAHPPGAGGLDRQPQADLPAVPQRWPGGAQAPQARSRGRRAPPATGAVAAEPARGDGGRLLGAGQRASQQVPDDGGRLTQGSGGNCRRPKDQRPERY